jgi:hypothetical protein
MKRTTTRDNITALSIIIGGALGIVITIACPNVINTLAAIVTIITGIVAVVFAIPSYVRNSKVRRAEWLSTLFEKFYESESYPIVRDVLDEAVDHPEDLHGIADLELAIAEAIGKKGDRRVGRISLNNYLNFFVNIANLKELDQLTKEQIQLLFSYDLGVLRKVQVLWDYICNSAYDFENLSELLKVIK